MQLTTHGCDWMNPHNSLSHFEFTELNNMVLKNGGTVAAPRSKRNVRYVAPRDLPNSTFGELLFTITTTLQDLPTSLGEITTGEGFS